MKLSDKVFWLDVIVDVIAIMIVGGTIVLALLSAACGASPKRYVPPESRILYKTEIGCWRGHGEGKTFRWCELERDCTPKGTCT